MEYVLFEWDEAKAQTNFVKHGLAFHEAVRVFSDEGRLDEDARQVRAKNAARPWDWFGEGS